VAAPMPAPRGGRIELVDFVDVTYPRVKQLLRDRWADVFGAGHPDHTDAATTAFGMKFGQVRLQTDVEIRLVDFTATRHPMRSCQATIECTPLQIRRYVTGLQSEVTAYPMSCAVTVLWLEASYERLACSPSWLPINRIVRACVEDRFNRVAQTVREMAAPHDPNQRSGDVTRLHPTVSQLQAL
jgi:hypothetical protein